MLNSICKSFIENFCMYIHPVDWSEIFFLWCGLTQYWFQGNPGSVKWAWSCSFSFWFVKYFEGHQCLFFSKGLASRHFFVGRHFITVSMTLLIIDLFKFLYSISFIFSNLLEDRFSNLPYEHSEFHWYCCIIFHIISILFPSGLI